MKNSIDQRLQEIKAAGRIGLMTHIVVGYPSLDATIEIACAMETAGADFIELQIPFADPLADGATIQKACEASLRGGTMVSDAFTVAGKLSKQIGIPLLFMGYFNTVYHYGIEKFCADAEKAGIAGLIIPDAPLEAADHEGLLHCAEQHNLHIIFTLSPASTPERIRKNSERATGFMYCMARQGVTGASQSIDPEVQHYLHEVRRQVQIPLAVGFGISNNERFKTIQPYCDVAVVGSALIDVINDSQPGQVAANVQQFIRELTKQPKLSAA